MPTGGYAYFADEDEGGSITREVEDGESTRKGGGREGGGAGGGEWWEEQKRGRSQTWRALAMRASAALVLPLRCSLCTAASQSSSCLGFFRRACSRMALALPTEPSFSSRRAEERHRGMLLMHRRMPFWYACMHETHTSHASSAADDIRWHHGQDDSSAVTSDSLWAVSLPFLLSLIHAVVLHCTAFTLQQQQLATALQHPQGAAWLCLYPLTTPPAFTHAPSRPLLTPNQAMQNLLPLGGPSSC